MNRKNASFVRQATFLMVAGLIVRIIGLLYRTPMKATIGGLGYGYYGYAYNVYNILLLISGYSIPVAVSKLMAERIAKKQYRNAQRVFWGAVLYILIIGSLAGLVAFIFARQLLPAGADGAVMALRILAPVILLAGLLGVLRGYFQANNNMMPTSVSQILEQILNAVVSVLAAWMLVKSFGSTPEAKASYGAAGGTLGTAAGVLMGILFMLLVFAVNRKVIKKRILRGQDRAYGKRFGNCQSDSADDDAGNFQHFHLQCQRLYRPVHFFSADAGQRSCCGRYHHYLWRLQRTVHGADQHPGGAGKCHVHGHDAPDHRQLCHRGL